MSLSSIFSLNIYIILFTDTKIAVFKYLHKSLCYICISVLYVHVHVVLENMDAIVLMSKYDYHMTTVGFGLQLSSITHLESQQEQQQMN